MDGMIAALLRERDGYLRAGKADRVAAVDEQLALRGHEQRTVGEPGPEVDVAGAAVKRAAAKTPAKAAPQGRSTRPKSAG